MEGADPLFSLVGVWIGASLHSHPPGCGSEMGMYLPLLLLLQCYLLTGFVCNAVAFVEEPSGGRSDGYCGRILRAQTQGTRREGHHEFRLRLERDPETYEPGTTYRGTAYSQSPFAQSVRKPAPDSISGLFVLVGGNEKCCLNCIVPVFILLSGSVDFIQPP